MKCVCKLITFSLFCLLVSPAALVFAQHVIPEIEKIIPDYGADDVDTQSQVEITFNSDMDKKSVEKNFHIFPKVSGSFKWQNNTLVFKPHEPLLPSTSYFISFTPELKTANGIPLPITYFNTPAEGVFVGPAGEINIVSINANVQELSVKGSNPVW